MIIRKKVLITVFCIIFIAMCIFTTCMSDNLLHIEHCHKEDCSICSMIELSTTFINNIVTICLYFLMLATTIYLVKVIFRKYKKIRGLTLVDLKIVQNN